MALRTYTIGPFTLEDGGQYTLLDDAPVINLEEGKRISIQAIIDDGSDDVSPAGSPDGSFQLYFAARDDAPFVRCEAADTGDESLEALAPQGDGELVNAIANFTDAPGTRAKIIYAYVDGTAARCTLHVTVS